MRVFSHTLVWRVRKCLPSFVLTLLVSYIIIFLGLNILRIKQASIKITLEYSGFRGDRVVGQGQNNEGHGDQGRQAKNSTEDLMDSQEMEKRSKEIDSLQIISVNRSASEKMVKRKKVVPKEFIINNELKLRPASDVNMDLQLRYDLGSLQQAPNCSFWNQTDMPPYTRLCGQRDMEDNALITLFTTMHVTKKDRHIRNNTLQLWRLLGPRVRRILFVSSPSGEKSLVQAACSLDWDVMTAPLCDRNNLPVLKSMFMAAQQMYNTTFYGYANGDIVFDESLLSTLDFIKIKYLSMFRKNLMVGRRTNIKLQQNQHISDLVELQQLASQGHDGWVAAVDYFISSRDGYDWPAIPKVVVGRVAYDNWIIEHAISRRYAVIDISNSTLSVHQTGQTGYYVSHTRRDVSVNYYLVKKLQFTKGLISCARLKTKLENGLLKLKKRVKLGMCGAGHWAKRNISLYGNETEADFDPATMKYF